MVNFFTLLVSAVKLKRDFLTPAESKFASKNSLISSQ